MQGQTVQRGTDREVLGNELSYHVAPYTTLSFGVNWRAQARRRRPPGRHCCGLRLRNPHPEHRRGLCADQQRVSSVTLYYHQDGLLHKVTGARHRHLRCRPAVSRR